MRWADPATWAARLGEVIFIPRSYGIFYHTAKNLLRHCKKIVLITWLLNGKFYIFNMDSNNFIRLQQFHFTVYSIMNMITAFSILLQLHGILLILVLLILDFTYLVVFVVFGKNSKTYACALKKNLSHVAGLAHLNMSIWQIFISHRWDPGKIKWDPT